MTTHIVRLHASQQTEQLFRASDGMRIGSCKEVLTIWGEDPNKSVGRCFIDHESASKYMREVVTANDLKERGETGDVVIEIQDIESSIIVAGETLAMPGAMRPIGGKFN